MNHSARSAEQSCGRGRISSPLPAPGSVKPIDILSVSAGRLGPSVACHLRYSSGVSEVKDVDGAFTFSVKLFQLDRSDETTCFWLTDFATAFSMSGAARVSYCFEEREGPLGRSSLQERFYLPRQDVPVALRELGELSHRRVRYHWDVRDMPRSR